MFQKKIIKNYVSELDRFLADRRKTKHQETLSQQQERQKHELLFKTRDGEKSIENKPGIWKGF